jgi:O-methyltransferase involved in polyketide biosynthesis
MTEEAPPGVDPTRPSPARVYDYALGGKDNYAVDRAAADSILKVAPEIRDLVVHNRRFLGRAVRYAGECGIDQFIDLGTGLPTRENVHQVAQRVRPEARVVYVDNDPTVGMHAQALLCSDEQTTFLGADLREPDAILGAQETRRLIDFDRPVAILMVAILHFLGDAEEPAAIVSRFAGALAPGSLLVISHATNEGVAEAVRAQLDATYGNGPMAVFLRSHAEIIALFAGLPLVVPGLVDVSDWRSKRAAPPGRLRALGGAGAVPLVTGRGGGLPGW